MVPSFEPLIDCGLDRMFGRPGFADRTDVVDCLPAHVPEPKIWMVLHHYPETVTWTTVFFRGCV
jgi:hypothetical protein